tara:strand:+ start:10238 stop:12931 length:2694 start_codon:yes stop_codon:yes gene_type:complete
MKWVGQHIWDFISRFRSDVYLESVDSGTIASGGNLGLDSNNKIVKSASPSGTIDLTSEVTGTLPVSSGGTGATSLADNSILTGTGTSAITAESTLIYDGGIGAMALSNTAAALLDLKQTANSTAGPTIRFTNTRGGNAGQDDDVMGNITFFGNDENGNDHSLASIIAYIADATDTDEAGKIEIKVATEVTTRQALTATGDGASSKVDIGLGYGTSSMTTIAGDLTVSGNDIHAAVDSNLTLRCDGSMSFVIDEDNDGSNYFIWYGNGSPNANKILMTLDDVGTFTVGGSDNATTAKIVISDVVNDAGGPELVFNKQRGATGVGTPYDGQDSDVVGDISFNSYDDGTPSTQTYAQVKATIADATSGQEAGTLTFSVAEYDGTVTSGLMLDGDTNANGEIDVTVGAGAASTTTIAGNLDIDGTRVTSAGALSFDMGGNIVNNPSSGINQFWRNGNQDDYLQLEIGADGDATFTTVDASAAAAHLGFTVDGNITLDAGAKQTYIKRGGSDFINFDYNAGEYIQHALANPNDVFKINVGAEGATTISTTDADTSVGHISIIPDGGLFLDPISREIHIGGDNSVSAAIKRRTHGDGDGGNLNIVAGSATDGVTNMGAGDLGFYTGQQTGNATPAKLKFYSTIQNVSSGGTLRSSSLISEMYTGLGTTEQRWYEAGGATDDDYFKLVVTTNGATTFSTVDAAGASANLTLDVDGDIELNADGGNITFKDGATTLATISDSGYSGKQFQVFPSNFIDDIGTSQVFLPIHGTTFEQSTVYQDDVAIVAPCDGRVVSVTLSCMSLSGSGNLTIKVYSIGPNNSGTSLGSWTEEENETLPFTATDDNHVFHFAFSNAKHFESTEKFVLSIQSDSDPSGNTYWYATTVVEWDYSTLLSGTSAEYDAAP